MKVRFMTDFSDTIDISFEELDSVCGGRITQATWNMVKEKAGPYCPNTVHQYGNINPASLDKAHAQAIANKCVAEMPFYAKGSGQSQFDAAIAQAFPAPRGR